MTNPTRTVDVKDTLVRSATSFLKWSDLTDAMTRNGYVPSLIRCRAASVSLGTALESEGYRVFWVDG